MKIRHSTGKDFDRMMEIYSFAGKYIAEHHNVYGSRKNGIDAIASIPFFSAYRVSAVYFSDAFSKHCRTNRSFLVSLMFIGLDHKLFCHLTCLRCPECKVSDE